MSMWRVETEEYQLNVLSRISNMESLVAGWGRRSLSMNGRMILAKTFLLSQIIFPAQFMQVQIKEMKKIERLIYAFINGARSLYGPEGIARRYLKADRTNGGICGIDVCSFLLSIAIRQFEKVSQLSLSLKSIQSSYIAERDDICKMALGQIKQGLT